MSARMGGGATPPPSGGFRVFHEPRSDELPKKSGKFHASSNGHELEPYDALVNEDAGSCCMFRCAARDAVAHEESCTLSSVCDALMLKAAANETSAQQSLQRELAACRTVLPHVAVILVRHFEDAFPLVRGAADTMLPALIFECVATNAVIPFTILPNPGASSSNSLRKRCATLLHDHRKLRGEELDAASATLSLKISQAVSDVVCSVSAQEALAAYPSSDELVVDISEKGDLVEVSCRRCQKQDNCADTTISRPLLSHRQKNNHLHHHQITRKSFDKLKRLFRGPREQDFPFRLFCVLERYFALLSAGSVGGASLVDESGWHAAVPPAALASLRAKLRVASECFASPLNTSSAFYCSAFADTDCFFGSVGSFFDVTCTGGGYEANPPFDHSVALSMVERMAVMLLDSPDGSADEEGNAKGSKRPLAFVVILPWADRGKALCFNEAIKRPVSSFLTACVVVPNRLAPYVDGNQQCEKDCMFLTRLDTCVMVLQNAEHRKIFDQAKVDDAVNAFLEVWASAHRIAAKRARDDC